MEGFWMKPDSLRLTIKALRKVDPQLDLSRHLQLLEQLPTPLDPASLFARSDEVELAWGIVDPILEAWASPAAPPLQLYPEQEWGPPCSVDWMRAQGREWFDVCPVLH